MAGFFSCKSVEALTAEAEAPGLLRLEFPQSAIKGIARASRRQQALQCLAVASGLDGCAYRLDLTHHRPNIVVFSVVDAGGFPTTTVSVLRERDDDYVEVQHRAAADSEGHPQRPILHFHMKRSLSRVKRPHWPCIPETVDRQ
jgi:hypothetical protein